MVRFVIEKTFAQKHSKIKVKQNYTFDNQQNIGKLISGCQKDAVISTTKNALFSSKLEFFVPGTGDDEKKIVSWVNYSPKPIAIQTLKNKSSHRK